MNSYSNSNRIARLGASVFAAFVFCSVRAEEWRIPSTESFRITSATVKRDYEIMVGFPRGYGESATRHPVLYVLDANGAFPIAVEVARFLAFDPTLKEQPVIVGIGYPVGLYRNTLGSRTRDFTPTPDPEWLQRISSQYEFSPDGSGGAAAFLRFLAKEMMPVVEARYKVDARRRALCGYSLGGLFATYALFHQPELFESFLIGAPYLFWDREVSWNYEQGYARTQKDLRARVLLTVGLLDKSYVPLVQKMDERVRSRKYPSLIWATQYYPDETHDSAMTLNISRGIRWLYGDMAPSTVESSRQ